MGAALNPAMCTSRTPQQQGSTTRAHSSKRRVALHKSLSHLASRAWRCAIDGTSAVEFALFAPMLIVGLLSAIDLGFAEYERMTIDHALRAGAQSAMADQGTDQVLKVVQNTASKNFTLSSQSGSNTNTLTLNVDRFCACPESLGVAVSCSTDCASSQPTFIYYRLSGAKTYTGTLLPTIGLNPSVQVQVR
jgi:pilus assembly protein CpaE